MKSGFWHLPAKVTGAVFLIIAVSGLAMAGASALPIDGGNGTPAAGVLPVSIERVFAPDVGDARIAADRLSFVLSLPPGVGGSFTGTLDLRNTADNAIMVDVTASNPDSMLIDFIDPLYGVSGQSGRQHWRLYLRGNDVSTIVYLLQAGRDSDPGSHEIEVTIIPEEARFSFTPVPAGQRMWGGDGPAITSPPPAVSLHPWAMFRHDPGHSGRSEKASLVLEPLIYWAGGFVNYSSAAIASDNTVYFGSYDNRLWAMTQAGMPIWSYYTENDVMSSPAIAPDGTIYVGSDNNSLYALNPNGTLKWSYYTGGDVLSSPVVGPDGTVYFGSFDDNLYAIRADGTLKWSYPTLGDIFSSPALALDGTIYFGSSDKRIYALNHDGTLKWFYTAGDVVHSSPAIGPDGTIYIGSADNYLYAMNPDGTLKWKYLTGARIDSSPAIAIDGTIYFGSFDSHLYALNPDGTFKWRYLTGGVISSSPAVDGNGFIYFGSWDKKYYALKPDGSLKSVYVPGAGFEVNSSPAIDANGRVVYVTVTGVPGG